jgi:beta-phosphoglucomutase-like phosphatase (HAD superfamily)
LQLAKLLTFCCSLLRSCVVACVFPVVEDTHIGLRAAKAAGMHCLVTKSIYTQSEDFGAADRVVDSLENPKIVLNDLSKITAGNI